MKAKWRNKGTQPHSMRRGAQGTQACTGEPKPLCSEQLPAFFLSVCLAFFVSFFLSVSFLSRGLWKEAPTRTRAAPNPTSRDCLQFFSSIRKAKSREKGRREESEDEGNEMILGSWTFISLSDKNKAREGDKRGEGRMGRLPLMVYFLPFFFFQQEREERRDEDSV